MEIRVINDKEDISKYEALRCKAFGLDYGVSKYYYEKLKQGTLLVFGAYHNDELVGCLYLSPFYVSNAYVDQVFVKEEYQNSDLHIGTSLLQYLEDNIESVSEYFDFYVNMLYIEYCDKRSESVYRNQGYKPTMLDGTLFKKVNY